MARLNSIEMKISENKMLIDSAGKKINDVEASQKFLADQYDEVSKQSVDLHADLNKLKQTMSDMKMKNDHLQEDNSALQEDVLDLKCRSMRDNLVFIGFSELPSAAAPRTSSPSTASSVPMETQNPGTYAQAAAAAEDCKRKVLEFCQDVPKIDNARERIHIDRAHRMGPTAPGKSRPIVAKFKDTASKMCVKNALRSVNLRNTPFNVFDQLPQEIQERRKALVPVMLKARSEGKRAYLVRDKLFINNRQYRHATD